VSSDGRYWEQGRWGNLPEGETFTCPASVDGVIAVEEIGDWFTEKYGMLSPAVRFVMKAGRIVSVETAERTWTPTFAPTWRRIRIPAGLVSLRSCTNVGLSEIVGNFLQDEKFPGVHIAFGDPYGFETGADWDCPSHVDVLASHATISVDGRNIMENGRFLV